MKEKVFLPMFFLMSKHWVVGGFHRTVRFLTDRSKSTMGLSSFGKISHFEWPT